jgi:predicted MFS family arabinose efflux permease
MNRIKKFNYLPWLMWLLVVSFFAYQFVMRLAPGLVMKDIMDKFGISASAFGFLSSMYYFGYAGMQIPIAALLDRYGVRIVVSICVFLCSLATIAFVYSDSWWLVLASRFLVGACSAAGFLGTSKIISEWFPNAQYGRLVAISFSYGLLGALYGGKPIAMLLETYSWQAIFRIVGITGFVLFALICTLVKSPKEKNSRQNDQGNILNNLLQLIKNRKLMLIAVSNLLMVGSLEGFADVWGVSYLEKVYNMTRADASLVTSMIFLGMLFGGPVLTYFAEKSDCYYKVTAMCGILISCIFVLMLTGSHWIDYKLLCILMFINGILCCYQVLVFTIGNKLVGAAMVGITVAFLNCINMLGGSFFHTTIGVLMDLFWDGSVENGIRIYGESAYNSALFAIPIASILGALFFLLLNSFNKRRENIA